MSAAALSSIIVPLSTMKDHSPFSGFSGLEDLGIASEDESEFEQTPEFKTTSGAPPTSSSSDKNSEPTGTVVDHYLYAYPLT
jgi:hypothetical protein